MKSLTILTSAAILLLCTHSSSLAGHGRGCGRYSQCGHSKKHNATDTATSPTVTKLTESQKNGLIFMYQEEKLARDVYRTLGEKWGSRVFINIQKAEQRHMDAVKGLLNKYSLDIPASDSNTGSFKNQELQTLYNTLIKQGKKSNQDAYLVGILVEKTDIKDLQERMTNAPADINAVYSNLLRGSNNHLRAFTRNSSGSSSSNNSSGNGGSGKQGKGHGYRHGRNK
jgi:hypothetical protein